MPYDLDEKFSLGTEPEAALEAILGGAGTEGEEVEMEPDIISDPGVVGGVNAPNEETEEPETGA
ncbi:MAG: hypothetical protein ACYDHP_02270 [Ferrimicrobium sp.]